MRYLYLTTAVLTLLAFPAPTMAQGRGHGGAMPGGGMPATPMPGADRMNSHAVEQIDMMRTRQSTRDMPDQTAPNLARTHREKRQAEEHIAPQGQQDANENAGFDQNSPITPPHNEKIKSKERDTIADKDTDKDRTTTAQAKKPRTAKHKATTK